MGGYNRTVKVSELGEFGLIDRLAELLAAQGTAAQSDRLFVGIGDDAAVWLQDGSALLATTDTLVEGVHFVPGRTSWRDLGWKSLAVNVSDIAAMGGRPELALVTLALRNDIEVEDLDELYRGLAEAAESMGVVIAGGDIVRAEEIAVSVTATGRAELDEAGHPKLLRRNGAQAGDVVAVTGALGGAAGGLCVLRGEVEDSKAARELLERHFRPRPRVAVGLAAIAAGIRCGIDVSDGLMQDLAHVCKSSRLGAVVWQDKLPVDAALRAAFNEEEAVLMAATGGEDYELLLAGKQEQIDALAKASDVAVTVVGEMVIAAEHVATLLDSGAKRVELAAAGWDHLRG
jgi:thiamine-monophosphate kinase